MWTTLNFKEWSKRKKSPPDICKTTLDIKFEGNWLVGLNAALGDGKKNLKYIFPVSGIFPGKPIVPYCWALNVL